MNFIGLILGIVAAILAAIAFIPFLGWLYWIIVPLAIIGLIFSSFGNSKGPRTLNIVVIIIGIIRLIIGSGVL